MERIVTFSPAWDNGVELRMVLKSDKGAVQFVLYTNWMLPHVEKELDAKLLVEGRQGKLSEYSFCTMHPMPADLGYHSPVPTYEGQSIASNCCEYNDGNPCYYDGSGLNSERIYEVLLKEGSEGVWRELEDYYKMIFESEENN